MIEPLRIAICEDTQYDAELLSKCIKETGVAAKVTVFASGEAFMEKYHKGLYHLIYLDIRMEGMSGMDVAAKIRECGDGVPLAFITTIEDYAFEANKYRSILFVKKPVKTDDVAHTLTVAEALRQRRASEVLSVADSERKKIDIPFDDISYIDVLDHRCTVHLIDGANLTLRTATTIDELDALLPKPPFLRCQRSYLVNLDHVRKVDKTLHAFIMKNDDRVDIRRSMLAKFEEVRKLRAMEKTGRDEG